MLEADTYPDFLNINVKPNSLYIVSTPIGNLEDISFRAIEILKKVDFIAAEDTRTSSVLLKHYGIGTRSISYHSYSGDKKKSAIIDEIKSGKSAALISDAGTPAISDPGSVLIKDCIESSIDIIPVPGASSLMNACILSGFNIKKFYFHGFLPQKKGRKKILDELKDLKMPVVLFESPYRIYRTLKDIYEVFGNKEVAISRELTKKYETIYRGKLNEIVKSNYIKAKGEFVIVVNG